MRQMEAAGLRPANSIQECNEIKNQYVNTGKVAWFVFFPLENGRGYVIRNHKSGEVSRDEYDSDAVIGDKWHVVGIKE